MLVDSHCHLDVEQFDDDREAVLARASDAGVRRIVNPGIDLKHCRQAVALAERTDLDVDVYAAVGIHPNSTGDFDERMLAEVRQLAEHPRVVAIGEIGLDYYWMRVPVEQQQASLRAQLAAAAELGLPVIIHSREPNAGQPPHRSCYADVAEILEEWVESAAFAASPLARRSYAGVLHAFGGDLELAERAYRWNFVLGLGGPVTFTNARRLHAVVPQLRLDRLMLETDAPYLAPHPHRGKRNEPAYLALVCDKLAELFDVSREEIARQTTATALRFFGLEEATTLALPDSRTHRSAHGPG